MPYVTSVERLALERGEEKGRQEGEEKGRREMLLETIATGLTARFKEEGSEFLATLQQVRDIEVLRTIQKAIWTAESLDDVRRQMR